MMNIEEEIGLPVHLLDHDYFRPVVYENNPIEELDEVEQGVIEEEVLEDEDLVEENPLNQVPLTYRMIPGVHHGSRIYVDNLGFKFYKREATINRVYLVCERQKSRYHEYCPCTASVSTELIDNRIKVRHQHNHGPADIDLHVPFLREAIGARSIDPENMSVSVRTAYNNAIVQYPEAANNYTFLQGQRRWMRMRRSRQPNGGYIPQNIHELAEALIRPENAAYSHTLQTPPSAFFQQELVVNGTSEGIIFANLDAIRRYREELATVTTVGIDGTFKTVPAAPVDLKSFLTFQVVFKDVSFPMVYVLLRSRTEETYITLFNIIRQILPLNYNLIRFVTDFEKGLMNAVQQSFPESRLGCCWFHYTQSIVRYCHRKLNGVLDLVKRNPDAARVFRMVLALPHLPAARGHPLCPRFCMYDGFRAIMQYVQQFPEVEQGMRNFLIGYIDHYWFFQVGPELISVFAEDYRTNNYLESFHSTLLSQMGRHPNIWDFLRESESLMCSLCCIFVLNVCYMCCDLYVQQYLRNE
ncbi:uncharacterized protein LOC112602037 [Melanaphis sacchari]|uniref:uncharacterized protein LOC112602037 n=1 Tax=Melanaphis sacchari TaxID=742174 RepID=UPI000DC14CF0|nr:uncharacterized protein LOC112602037 [Melanaphis sacchari]